MINNASQGTVDFSTNRGRSAQLRFKWYIGPLAPGDVATLSFCVRTDHNPAGKQEFTSCGIHVLNSGATLKYLNASGKQQSKTTDTWAVQVCKPTPLVTTELSSDSITLGESVTDTVVVTGLEGVYAAYGGLYPDPTGTVDFQVNDGLGWVAHQSGVSLDVNGEATSDTYVPPVAGTYYFRAIYHSGDSSYDDSQSGDEEEPLTVYTPG